MSKLTAFFDAAGHPQGEHSLIVCGHVSSDRKWVKFETEWKHALVEAGIVGPFHMTEFMTCVRSFTGWLPRVEDRARLLTKLIGIIKRNVYKAFSEAILLDDWKVVNKVFQLTESHCTPYALASFYAMDRTIRWWGRKHGRDEMTEFVFEEGDKNKGDFMWMMEQIIRGDRRRFEKVAPVFKRKELVALQAADLVGWTMRRAMKVERTNVRERSIPPAVLEALVGVRHIPHLAGYLDRDKLMKFCENFGVPRRGEAGTWAGIVRH